MIAYKGTTNLKCKDQVYEVGKTYFMKREDVELCKSGFHFCEKLENVNKYYGLHDKDNIAVEIEVDEKDIVEKEENEDKSVASKIKILRIVSREEYDKLTDGKFKWKNRCFAHRDSNGFWSKNIYNKNNNIIKYESSTGFWAKYEYDKNDNLIKYENSKGFWYKQEYDENGGNIIIFENSEGYREEYNKMEKGEQK